MPLESTFFFKAGNYGWTESHAHSSDEFVDAQAASVLYVAARRAAMPQDVALTHFRIRDPLEFRNSRVYTVTGGGPGTLSAGEAENPFVALLIAGSSAPAGNRVRQRRWYYRGFRDAIVDADTPVPITADQTEINAALNSLVTNGFGWMGYTDGTPADVIDVSLDAEKRPVLTVLGASFAVGTRVRVRGLNIPCLGGVYRVLAVGAGGTITISGPVNLDIPPYYGTGQIMTTEIQYYGYTSNEIIRAVDRATGRPFGLPVGRRARRKCGCRSTLVAAS